jgi:GTP-binding protein HflX
METKPPIPLAVLGGIKTPNVDDVAHKASLVELGRLVKTLGYNPSYSAHSRDSETTIVQRIDFTHRVGVSTHPLI